MLHCNIHYSPFEKARLSLFFCSNKVKKNRNLNKIEDKKSVQTEINTFVPYETPLATKQSEIYDAPKSQSDYNPDSDYVMETISSTSYVTNIISHVLLYILFYFLNGRKTHNYVVVCMAKMFVKNREL